MKFIVKQIEISKATLEDDSEDLRPLFEAIVARIPAAPGEADDVLQLVGQLAENLGGLAARSDPFRHGEQRLRPDRTRGELALRGIQIAWAFLGLTKRLHPDVNMPGLKFV